MLLVTGIRNTNSRDTGQAIEPGDAIHTATGLAANWKV
jgi:hypothetical protein